MHWTSIVLLLCTVSLFAQDPADPSQKAPTGVEEALRERVNFFYQAHVDGKFRVADTVVHEDSKDAFFAADKRKLLAFEIKSITYSAQFTSAKVVVDIDTDVAILGMGLKRLKIPIPSTWKLDGGLWYWYVQPKSVYETPFGTTKPSSESGGTTTPFRIPNPTDAAKTLDLVKIDKPDVAFKVGEAAAAEVVVSNEMPGTVSFSLEYTPQPYLEIRLDREELQANERAKVSIRYQPSNENPATEQKVEVRVKPTGRILLIRITFTGRAN